MSQPQTISDRLRDPAQAVMIADHAADVMEQMRNALIEACRLLDSRSLALLRLDAAAALIAFNGEE